MREIPIVIVNYKDYALRYLAACVASLRLVTDTPWKLFIVDNASTAETRALIRSLAPEAELLPFEDNTGYAVYSRIAPLLRDRGYEYMLIANMDIEVTADCLAPLVAALEKDPACAAVQSRLMLFGRENEINSLGNVVHYLGFGYSVGGYRSWDAYKDHVTGPRQICYGSGAFLLVRLTAVAEVGLFDPDFFMYHEDLDFGWKLLLAGKKTVLVPSSVVYHKYEFARSTRQYFWMERNRFICIFKNYRLGTLLLLAPMLSITELGLLVFATARGFLPEKMRVYAEFFKPATWKRIRAGRAQIAAIRKVGDKEVVRWFTGRIDAQQAQHPLVTSILNPLAQAWFTLVKILVIW